MKKISLSANHISDNFVRENPREFIRGNSESYMSDFLAIHAEGGF